MVTVDTRKLIEAIAEAEAYRLPDMNEGAEYLYNNLYRRLAEGDNVTLSSLDFDSFESDDIASLSSMYEDVFERNGHTANCIRSTLRRTAPVCKTVSYT